MFIKFFISFFILIVIPVAISNVNAYLNTKNMLKDEAIRSYTLFLENIEATVDQRLKDLYSSILQLSNDDDLKIALATSSINDSGITPSIINLSKKIESIRLSHSIAEDIFIYFRNLDKVYYGGTYDKQKFFNDYFGGYAESTWDNNYYFHIMNNNFLEKSMDGSHNFSSKTLILYTFPYYQGSSQKPKVQAIISINKDNVSQYLKYSDMVKGGKILVLSTVGDIIFSSDDTSENVKISSAIKGLKGNGNIVNYDGKQYFYKLVEGQYGLKFLAVIPTKVIFSKAEHIKNIIIFDFFLFFLLGIVLSYVFSQWMYRPIQNVIHFIEGNSKAANNKVKGEMGFIQANFLNLSSENKNLKDKINEGIPIIKERLAFQLLNGLIDNEAEFISLRNETDFFSNGNFFCTVCVRIESNAQKNENEYFLYKNLCINHIKEMTAQANQTIFTQINENVIAVIMTVSKDNDPVLVNFIDGIQDLVQTCGEYIRIFIGVGEDLDGFHKVKKSYNQAMKALDYRKINQQCQVIYFKNLEHEHHILYYPADKENIIVNALLTGNHDTAVKTFEYILHKNLENALPYLLINKLLTEFYWTVHRVINRVDTEKSSIILNTEQSIYEFSNYDQFKQHVDLLYDTCQEICNFVNHKAMQDEKSDLIKKFIDDNLHNDIYLDLLALHFDLTPSYLSKYFKEHFGMNFLDYVNKERIRKAKQLLASTNQDIQGIAMKVGFKSGNTLARIFKKCEGISPSQFRELFFKAETMDIT